MPELPEVETIKTDLQKKLIGRKITGLKVSDAKSVEHHEAALKQNIFGKKILNIERKGKILIFSLSQNAYLAIHLKITGQLIIKKASDPLDRFTRVIIYLDGGLKLYFNDLRKFGWLKYFSDQNELDLFIVKFKLGIEPLSRDFTYPKFNELLNRRKNMVIKQFLLDQSLVSGIGNIYALESLFHAQIRPTRRARTLKQAERKKLYQEVIRVLKLAVRQKGTSVDQYVDAYGQKGHFDGLLKVYDRKGESCYRCPGKVKMIKIGGRGTYFCPQCQK